MSALASSEGQRRFIRFLATGGIAALANIVARIGLSLVMPYEPAVVVAYLIGMTVAYMLARLFVFEPSGKTAAEEFAKFALVNVVALLVVAGVSSLLARVVFPALGFVWHPETVAHVIGVLSPVVVSYFGHKHFSFGK